MSLNNSDDILEILDLDVIYLSYDEPQKEEFWVKIKNLVPWAKRVDGVKGSDAAHKQAAKLSETERFILIDGDNLPDEKFFDLKLDFSNKDPSYKLAQFRWRANNHINGLRYGNGGMSSWTKTYVKNMRTHELSDGDSKHTVDFCLDGNDSLYWAMHDCYSTTYPNYSSFQAWRAGFREGVKMCLVRGEKTSILDFKKMVHGKNLNNLTIWHNVGMDIENGNWAIYGARLGTYLTMLTDWDYNEVQDFDKLKKLWENFEHYPPKELTEQLKLQLSLPIVDLNADQSRFFKHHLSSTSRNVGTLVKEIDVIRQKEGW